MILRAEENQGYNKENREQVEADAWGPKGAT